MTKVKAKAEKRKYTKPEAQEFEVEAKWKNFLEVLAAGPPNIFKACKATGMCRTTVYEWIKSDPDKKAEHDRALKLGQEAFRDFGYELAEKNHVIYMFMMKALFSEYRDKQELAVSGNLTVSLNMYLDGEKDNVAKS